MSAPFIKITLEDTTGLAQKLRSAASGDFKEEFTLFIESIGYEFLRILQDEIIRRNVVDSRLLLNSFSKGDEDNVWNISDGGMTLEVGTNVSYAVFVNDGHWMNPQGVAMRFVPGYWRGGRFVHTPGASSGMMLKQQWVEGAHYWEASIRILEKILPKWLEAKVQQWINSYFS